jgi:hypothetical protein
MRFGLILAAALGCAALLGAPARPAFAMAMPQITAPVAAPGMMHQAAYYYHGHRYYHRRWVHRYYYHGRWVNSHWRYY